MTVHVVRSQSQKDYCDSPHWLFQESRYWRCSPIRNLRSRGLEVMFHWRFVVRPLFRTRTRGLGGRGRLLRLSLGPVELELVEVPLDRWRIKNVENGRRWKWMLMNAGGAADLRINDLMRMKEVMDEWRRRRWMKMNDFMNLNKPRRRQILEVLL